MSLESKKQKDLVEDSEKRDRLSELPDEVLIHILSFLPTLEAVRTMLIRPFGNLWTLVPNLDFDSNQFSEHFDVDKKRRFRLFVRNVMKLHKASVIDSFRLEIWVQGDYYWIDHDSAINEIYKWIRRALKKKAKIVDLHIDGYDELPLPYFLFTNQSVVELSLKGCELEYERKVYMGSLRSLSLFFVYQDGETFREMVSGFPSLEKLIMVNCTIENITLPSESIEELVFYEDEEDWFCHKINCPYLKILDLCGCLGYFEATDLSSVRVASIRFYPSNDGYEVYASQTTEFLKKLENAEILTFNALTFKDVTFPKNKWKYVTLTNTFLLESHVLCVYSLMRNSPCLEELVINAEDGLEYAEVKSDKICQELSSPCVAPCLREVHIYSEMAHDHPVQLQLVKFLLKCAVVLDELVIFSPREEKPTSRVEKLNIVEKISRFPRASANVRIRFV